MRHCIVLCSTVLLLLNHTFRRCCVAGIELHTILTVLKFPLSMAPKHNYTQTFAGCSYDIYATVFSGICILIKQLTYKYTRIVCMRSCILSSYLFRFGSLLHNYTTFGASQLSSPLLSLSKRNNFAAE